ncbi:dephospho-CoA kinase [Sulfoacidibacillus thermotolerans]|uniref:Dephospho-CoA kinase n=1 Tax=Sulfoacidibacillus thermotolerans TaxID=1765684 RepID=A0A2U3DA33_SULT2|nr:dephospho-CoA kinase [Sulfoacidibacillus thermotolerans]
MIVGLTGGIATGKSSISAALVELGAYLIDADVIAREVVAPGTEGLRQIVNTFGAMYVQRDGSLHRDRLGQLVFQDEEARNKLNEIVHPLVRAEMWRRARDYVGKDASRIAILDVPLLIEGGTHRQVDVTVLVYASAVEQLKRLMKRNGLDEVNASRRIAAQISIEEKRAYADILVNNQGEEREVPRLAHTLYQHLKYLAKKGAQVDGKFDRSVVQPFVIQ